MKNRPSTNNKTSRDALKAHLAEHPGIVVMDGMGTLPQLPDSIPERKVIIDQALSILRGLRARDADSAATLANEVLGY